MKTTISLLIHELNSGTYFRLQCCAAKEFVVFTLLSLRSEWSQGFHIHVSYEVRPSPDVAVFVQALAVLSLGLLCVYCTLSNSAGLGGNGGRGMFVLFLVQYAVHKSLVLEIFTISLNFLLNGYFAVFFSIKTLLTIETACGLFVVF